jgi:hypothetical protein
MNGYDLVFSAPTLPLPAALALLDDMVYLSERYLFNPNELDPGLEPDRTHAPY